jgi:hypothetical protein
VRENVSRARARAGSALGADDIPGDLAELYGSSTGHSPIPNSTRLSNRSQLGSHLSTSGRSARPSTSSTLPAYRLTSKLHQNGMCALPRITRPAAQNRIKTLMQLGFHKPGDVKERLGHYVGRLGREQPGKENTAANGVDHAVLSKGI